MSWNPLPEVTDYRAMLNRILLFTTASACIGIWLLRRHFPALDAVLTQLDFKIEIWGVKEIKLVGYIVPGLVVGFLTRSIRLHDRISDVLGIRQRFDVKFILVPLAIGTGIQEKDIQFEVVKARRDDLMGPVFYRFASSTNPQIDKHLICEALDWWSWYWVIVESASVFFVVAIILIFAKAGMTVVVILACIAVSLGSLPFFKHHCARYAKREVQEILNNPTRKKQVKEQFTKCNIKQKGT